MPFGHKSQYENRIWSFKAKPPLDEEVRKLVEDRMHAAHGYRNALIALECTRRDEVWKRLVAFDPTLPDRKERADKAHAEFKAFEDQLAEQNQRARARVATAADRQRLKELKAESDRLYGEFDEAQDKAYADPAVAADLKAIGVRDEAARKELYHSSPLHWGIKNFIKQSRSGDRRGAPPEFRRWTEEQVLAFQMQKGLPWTRALAGTDTRLRVEVLPPGAMARHPGPAADPASRRSREHRKAIVHIRLESEAPGTRRAIYVRVPIHLHRMPPEDAVITNVYLHRTMTGRQRGWEVQFVLGRDSWEDKERAESGACAVDLGWRLLEGGLRVACAAGDDGREHGLALPAEMLGAWKKVEQVQSTRDLNYDAIRARLADWLAPRLSLLTDWHKEQFDYLLVEREQRLAGKEDDRPKRRSPGRLSRIARLWQERRFRGDDEILEEVLAWRHQETHLHNWQAGQTRQLIRRRDDLYRKFARDLSRAYHAVKLRKVDYKALKARPTPGETDSQRRARLYRDHAAPGRLAALIREAFEGAHHAVPMTHPVKPCSACGQLDRFDAAQELIHTCSGCGASWDHDRNTALNLLKWEPVAKACAVGD